MKTRLVHLIAGCTMLVLCISICTTTSNAALVWQDNFDVPGLEDWIIFAYENLNDTDPMEGNFSDASGALEVLDDDMNFARHLSTTSVGTWSFDMFVPENENVEWATYVYIMSNGSRQIPTYPSDFIAVGAWNREIQYLWSFIVWTMNGLDWIIHKTIYRNPGWHHIDVSRTNDGHFYVWFNGTLETDFIYNDVTRSTYLEFYSYNAAGAAIDNLVVRDDFPIPFPTPTPTPTPSSTPPPPPLLPWDLIAVGGGGALVVIVAAIVFLRRR
ncbi:MAG: hypothetical protein ACFFAX_14320 [Promethearchaeota archaeon]